MKVEILKILRDLNIASVEFVQSAFREMVDLSTPFTEIRREMLCSSNFDLSIPASAIPAARWSEMNFITAIMCLKSKEPAIQEKILLQLTSKDPILRGTLVWFFYDTRTKDINIHLALARTLSDPDRSVRQLAAMVLGNLLPDSQTVIEIMAKALVIEQDQYVYNSIRGALEKLPSANTVSTYLIDHADSSIFRDDLLKFGVALKQK